MPENTALKLTSIEPDKTRKQTTGIGISIRPDISISEPPKGIYGTYRLMRQCPVIGIARQVSTLPIRRAEWSVLSQEGTPEERVVFIDAMLDQIWPQLIRNILRAKDYGWQGFEKVHAMTESGFMTYAKIKPLIQDRTSIMVDENGSDFTGLKQGDVHLLPEQSYLYTYDEEAGNLYGRSINENVRAKAWWPWDQTLRKQMQYMTKIAGVIPLIEYPVGVADDEHGSEKSTFEICKGLIEKLSKGEAIAMPNLYQFEDVKELVRHGADLDKLKQWHIGFVETPPGHGDEFISALKYHEANILRGYFVPERSVIEGMHGTKAEAGVHGDLADELAMELFDDIVRSTNKYLIDPILSTNWGFDAVGTVYIKRTAVNKEALELQRDIVRGIYANPHNIDIVTDHLNLESILEQLGIDHAEDLVSVPATDLRDVENNMLRSLVDNN